MGELQIAPVGRAIAITGRSLHVSASSCTFGAVCRAVWPKKTAEHLAARTGGSVRAAKYRIAGVYEPTACDIAAIIVEITKFE